MYRELDTFQKNIPIVLKDHKHRVTRVILQYVVDLKMWSNNQIPENS